VERVLEVGTARFCCGIKGQHCHTPKFAGLQLKLSDYLHLRYGHIFPKFHDQKAYNITDNGHVPWFEPFEIILKHL
jgi:hypothetical protein